MSLDIEAINEFKKLYLQEYNISLTDEQALGFGTNLVRLVKAVYGNNLPVISLDNSEIKHDN